MAIKTGGPGVDTLTGTTSNDTFRPKTFGDVVIEPTAGGGIDTVEAYFDFTLPPNVENFKAVSEGSMLTIDFGGGDVATLAKVVDTSQPLVGSWIIDGNTVITFLPDGTYMMAEAHEPEGGGMPGMERGTWSQPGGNGTSITTTTTTDTSGEWGLSHTTILSAQVSGNSLTLDVGDDVITLARVTSTTKPLVGAWWLADSNGDMAVITFLASGNYKMAEMHAVSPEGGGMNGIELGTYTWNASSGAFTTAVNFQTNGEWGLGNNASGVTASIDGGTAIGNTLANTMTGDGGNNDFSGLGGNDTLKGMAGADYLDGGAGADFLFGGTGKDVLIGGTGIDKFVFDAPATAANADTVQSFVRGTDKIVLDDDVFTKFAGKTVVAQNLRAGTAAVDSNDYLIYDASSGKLYYDADGSGTAKAAVLIATLSNKPATLGAADFEITG